MTMQPERVGILTDAPAPCRHKNINPIIVEKVAATMRTAERLIVKCPVEGCEQEWYMLDPEPEKRWPDGSNSN